MALFSSRRSFLKLGAGVGAGLGLGVCVARPAFAGDTVRVGMTTALSGPAKALGEGMRDGLTAHFEAINAEGGIHGRRIELVALDDGYEPARAAQNMRQLIDEHGVFAILGNAGTPTAAVTVPIAVEKRVPLFGAFTGAQLLRRDPPDRYILNFRASYAQETAAMVHGVVNELGIAPEHIGFFTQNDAYGDSGYGGGIAALEAMGVTDAKRLPHGRYARNTVFVEDGLSRLMDPRVDVRAVVMVGAYNPCAQMIRLARQHGFGALCMNVSFVGSRALGQAIGPDADGVVVTEVVPHPDGESPAATFFRTEVAPAKRSVISFEGHLVARAFVAGLREAGPGADREAWLDAMESGTDLALGLGEGTTQSLSPTQHQIAHRVWPSRLVNGGFEAMNSWTDVLDEGVDRG